MGILFRNFAELWVLFWREFCRCIGNSKIFIVSGIMAQIFMRIMTLKFFEIYEIVGADLSGKMVRPRQMISRDTLPRIFLIAPMTESFFAEIFHRFLSP